LTPLTGNLHTKADGQVFDAVHIIGRLYVDHKNVVIKRSLLTGDQFFAVYPTIKDAHLTVEDSEITGKILVKDHFIARRNYVHAPAGGTKADGFLITVAANVLIEENFIAGLAGPPGSHVDGIQVAGGTSVVLRHNWIEASSPPVSGGGVNAAVFFSSGLAPTSDVTIECNMLILKGGYHALRLYNVGGPVVVRGNRWEKGFLGQSFNLKSTTVSVWQDNAYTDGTPIPPP